MSIAHNPTVRHPGEGCTIGVVGDVYRFLATGDETNGKYAMWEAMPRLPKKGDEVRVYLERKDDGYDALLRNGWR